MTTETAERQPNIPPTEEGTLMLTSLGTLVGARLPCSKASEKDMAYYSKGHVSESGLTATEAATLRNYCGPCPFQELCLAEAVVTENLRGGIIGGLNQKDRQELDKYYDPVTKSIPKKIWNLVVDAVLEEKSPFFPGGSKPNIEKNGSRKTIINFLSQHSNREYTFEPGGVFYVDLAEAVGLNPLTTRRVVYKLLQEGSITKSKEGHYITALRVAA
jgi:hypothetical protein